MENVERFVDKIRRGGVCLGTGITFTDPTSTEALCDLFDFLWIEWNTRRSHWRQSKGI